MNGGFRAFGLLTIFEIAACGGPGANANVAPLQPAVGSATLTITIPRAGSSVARKLTYVSPGTASLVVQPSNYASQTFTVNPLTPPCTGSTTTPTCPVIAMQGASVSFAVTAFGGPAGTGSMLSSGTSATIAVGVSNSPITVTLMAVPAVVTSDGVYSAGGCPATFTPMALPLG